MDKINISLNFTKTPGARYKTDGPHSGEDFREKFLSPKFKDLQDQGEIVVELDGVEGYATSFLEEAFGGLAREFGSERCLRRLRFVSEDELLIKEIKEYITLGKENE